MLTHRKSRRNRRDLARLQREHVPGTAEVARLRALAHRRARGVAALLGGLTAYQFDTAYAKAA